MFKSKIPVVLMLVTALVAVGCASTRPVGDQMSDAAITTKVKSKLAADPEVNPFRIDIDTQNGIVTLRGKVEKESARAEAEKHAANTGGVVEVRNLLTLVGPDADGSYLSDKGIAARVKAKLASDPELNPFNIDVDVKDAVVTLSGTVRSETSKAEAEKVARSAKGVQDVHNELEVRPYGTNG